MLQPNQVLRMIKTVIAFETQDVEQERFNKAVDDSMKAGVKSAKYQGFGEQQRKLHCTSVLLKYISISTFFFFFFSSKLSLLCFACFKKQN